MKGSNWPDGDGCSDGIWPVIIKPDNITGLPMI